MLTRVLTSVLLWGLLSIVVGCSNSAGRPAKDAGNDLLAGDFSTVPLSCVQIIDCINTCAGDPQCSERCRTRGQQGAIAAYDALLACQEQVTARGGGPCASVCNDIHAQACVDCVASQCETAFTACLGGGGVPQPGLGNACNPQQSGGCPSPLECLPIATATSGMCTKRCSNRGGLCEGAAVGQQAACILDVPDSSGAIVATYCTFICVTQTGKNYDCPSQLRCATVDNPPGSGQKTCDPSP